MDGANTVGMTSSCADAAREVHDLLCFGVNLIILAVVPDKASICRIARRLAVSRNGRIRNGKCRSRCLDSLAERDGAVIRKRPARLKLSCLKREVLRCHFARKGSRIGKIDNDGSAKPRTDFAVVDRRRDVGCVELVAVTDNIACLNVVHPNVGCSFDVDRRIV